MANVIVEMEPGATAEQTGAVLTALDELGFEARLSSGRVPDVVGAVGSAGQIDQEDLAGLAGVARVVIPESPFTFVSREFQPVDTRIEVGPVVIGGGMLVVAAGPCAVESREQLWETAAAVKAAGAQLLRGDAYKPRTSPYSFQGLGEEALKLLADARAEFGLPVIAEVLDPRHVELVAGYVDMLRVGTRNMSNYPLLAEVGRQAKPVQLKRGFNATVDEWLTAAEYIYKEGNPRIVLVERGIRTFETAARNTLDLTAVAVAKRLSHLPVMVDPSHASGRRELVGPLALAAVAAGADGVMIDVHPHPEEAKVDGPQALLPAEFADLAARMFRVKEALGA
ncbi:MAG TPA: 3-deoxy-7-phosphoheptulonate synthase [Acidimicrobiia bacterium]|jgi:3-deoxy-7-phosphoheptulonate synthase